MVLGHCGAEGRGRYLDRRTPAIARRAVLLFLVEQVSSRRWRQMNIALGLQANHVDLDHLRGEKDGICWKMGVACQSNQPFPLSAEAILGNQMPVLCDTLLTGTPGLVPADLNQSCFCITIDQAKLDRARATASGNPGLSFQMAESHPHLFSNVPVFLPAAALEDMQNTVKVIEAVARIPAIRDAVMAWAPEISLVGPSPAGALMGYDFHLGDDGPKLIEVNTNTGGAFLNALLARAQSECCAELVHCPEDGLKTGFEARVLAIFREEWQRQRGDALLRRIAIIDGAP